MSRETTACVMRSNQDGNLNICYTATISAAWGWGGLGTRLQTGLDWLILLCFIITDVDTLNRLCVPSTNSRVPDTGACNIGSSAPSASQRVPITYSQPSRLGLNIPLSSAAFSVSPLRQSTLAGSVQSTSADPSWDKRGSLGKSKSGAYKKGGNQKKKLPTWSHTFARKEQDAIPDSQERASLLAGLGEKKITFDEYQ